MKEAGERRRDGDCSSQRGRGRRGRGSPSAVADAGGSLGAGRCQRASPPANFYAHQVVALSVLGLFQFRGEHEGRPKRGSGKEAVITCLAFDSSAASAVPQRMAALNFVGR